MQSHNYKRFSIRGTLVITALAALGFAWPRWGTVAGPIAVQVSIACAVVGGCLWRRSWGATLFRRSSALLLMLCLLYLSFGPASWAHARYIMPKSAMPASSWTAFDEFFSAAFVHIYKPVAGTAVLSPEPVRSWTMTYLAWWMPSGTRFCDWGDGMGWHRNPVTYTAIHY
ncbi:hypothetical protein Poly51_62280 [Rubripirellula tenax]|uniref:Uncharacterized protein n=1 Tax=Rubripirellula tenax TaxID=2528015 RepID=A0A5C6E8B1_9BACT|nr:hypothetical protein Poly51_62280 [Rubripirellula tenax]